MAKKASTSKAKIKSDKKAKASQKVEKKEKKKAGKSKRVDDEEEDDQDLEGILDQVRISSLSLVPRMRSIIFVGGVVDEKGMGGIA